MIPSADMDVKTCLCKKAAENAFAPSYGILPSLHVQRLFLEAELRGPAALPEVGWEVPSPQVPMFAHRPFL